MPCDRRLKKGQSIQERATEIKKVVETVSRKLTAGTIKAIVGKDGGIAFQGLSEGERDGVTDACMYRRVMATGSSLAKSAIARAEAMAGRSVDKVAVGRGLHTHDGVHWHHHKG